jgi:histidinol-phosphate aminotransferase
VQEFDFLPQPAIAGLHRVRDPGSDHRKYICLDRNERLSPFPAWFMEKIRASLSSDLLTGYPFQDEFLPKLAAKVGLPEEMLLPTAGSDAAVKALFQAYVRPGDRVVMLEPSYAMYPVYARMFQAEAVRIEFDRNLAVNEEELLGAVKQGVRLVMLANPNQPTGTLIKPETLRNLIQRALQVGALVAIDEAYYPFSDATVLPWVRDFANLLVIRTFSKASGLAGLRVGWVAAAAEIVKNLFKVRSAHDVNGMAMLCAGLILEHPEIVESYRAEVRESARVLALKLEELDLIPLPTAANFLLFRVAHRASPQRLAAALKEMGYLVKASFDSPCIADCIRVTLGPSELMLRFAECLKEILRKQAAI